MFGMPSFVHPSLDDVALPVALHALADPVRLEMVRNLIASPALTCTATCPTIPKSTLSNHFRVLRQAGLVRTSSEGREARNALRREEFDRRFPGLLEAVLAQADPAAV